MDEKRPAWTSTEQFIDAMPDADQRDDFLSPRGVAVSGGGRGRELH